jgi:hypothetical protein
MTNRSIGRVYTAPDGRTYRPSTLLTCTLPSFGPVHTGKRMRRGQQMACDSGQLHTERDPLLGTPLDPETFDYREHALALIFFPQLLDVFWKTFRRRGRSRRRWSIKAICYRDTTITTIRASVTGRFGASPLPTCSNGDPACWRRRQRSRHCEPTLTC